VDAPADTLLYRRRADGDERLVAIHFGSGAVDIPLGGDHVVEVASDGAGEGASFDGTLSGDRAVVLKPSSRGADSTGDGRGDTVCR
jgi:hypothetical protein